MPSFRRTDRIADAHALDRQHRTQLAPLHPDRRLLPLHRGLPGRKLLDLEQGGRELMSPRRSGEAEGDEEGDEEGRREPAEQRSIRHEARPRHDDVEFGAQLAQPQLEPVVGQLLEQRLLDLVPHGRERQDAGLLEFVDPDQMVPVVRGDRLRPASRAAAP